MFMKHEQCLSSVFVSALETRILLLLTMFYSFFLSLFTQRRSVAKNVGCFRRRLHVCGFVRQSDPPPSKNGDLDRFPLITFQPQEIVKKFDIEIITQSTKS